MTKALIRSAQSVIPTQSRPASQQPAAVYLAGLAKGSRSTMRTSLETIAMLLTGHTDARAVDWGALRFQHTAAIRAELLDRYAPATSNRILAALRGVLKTAWRLGQMSAEDYSRARDVANVPGSVLPAGRALSAGEIAALLDACAADPTPAGARDAALIALLRAGGLRRAEICALQFDDYDPATGQLVVHGKRNKERTAYVQGGSADALTDWLVERLKQAAAVGPLFCPVNRGGHVVVRQMKPDAIYNCLIKRAKQAGVRKLSPHDLRRTFVSDLLDAGADISTVQKLAGHASVTTTTRYDRRGEDAKRKAVELLHVPYTRRKAK